MEVCVHVHCEDCDKPITLTEKSSWLTINFIDEKISISGYCLNCNAYIYKESTLTTLEA